MKMLSTLLSIVIVFVAMGPAPVIARQNSNSQNGDDGSTAAATLIVPLTGTVAPLPGTTVGGTFTGSFSIMRFEARNNTIFAVGMVSGAISGPAPIARTGISGPLTLQVTATSGGPHAARGAIVLAQATCDVLHLQLGGDMLNLLGLQVALSPVTLDLTGGTGPLGNLVCQIVGLLNNVAGVVGLLNQLLGVVGGLVGGAGA